MPNGMILHNSSWEKNKKRMQCVAFIAELHTAEKAVEMLRVRDITAVTGYVRGDCSPLGMKKQFPTVIHESAASYDRMYISGGHVGKTIAVTPDVLISVIRGTYADVIRHDAQ